MTDTKKTDQGPAIQDLIGREVTSVKIGDVLDGGVYTESKILNGAETFTSKGSIGAEVSVSVVSEFGAFNGLQVSTQKAASLNAARIGSVGVSVDSKGVVVASVGRSLGVKDATVSAGVDSTGNLEARLGVPLGLNQTGGVYGRMNPLNGIRMVSDVTTSFTDASLKALTLHIDGRINSAAGMAIRTSSLPNQGLYGDSNVKPPAAEPPASKSIGVGPATQAYRDYVADQKERGAEDILRDVLKLGDPFPKTGNSSPPLFADSPRLPNPLSPTYGPVTPGGPPRTIDTPAGPKVVHPGSTYVPPSEGPKAPTNPVVPTTVTWGSMANPGAGSGGGKPTAPPVGNLKPKTPSYNQESNRDRQADRPTSGGSQNDRDRQGGPTRPTSGGSGGGGSGGSGGGSASNPNKGPSFEYSGRSGSPAPSKTNSSAGGWGDMANAGYGKSTGTSGGSGQKTTGSGSKSSGGQKETGRDTSPTGAARPIILDLGGDGFDVSFTGTARFDMDGDGFRERVGWADAQDALLVLDLNADGSRGAGDGKIDQAKEVVLSLWGDAGMTDMEALAKARDANGQLMFDTNGDGKLTAADAAWGEFRVWQDADQDGVTDAGELKTLDQMGFTEIGLTYDDGAQGNRV
jgi:hypothetical protein